MSADVEDERRRLLDHSRRSEHWREHRGTRGGIVTRDLLWKPRIRWASRAA